MITDDADESNDPRRFIVCGANPMAYRLADELTTRYDVRVTAVLPRGSDPWGDRIRTLAAVDIVDADHLDADAFTRARLLEAAAIGLIEQDDGGNIDAALLAQEINPDIRIVMRMFNSSLGERIAQLLNDCVVLSAGEIAAPVFVRAALEDSTTPVTIAGRSFVATRRDLTNPDDVVMGLALSHAGAPIDPEVLPPPDTEGLTDIVLSRGTAPTPRRPSLPKRGVSALSVLAGARLRLVIAVLLAIFVAGTAVMTWIKGNVYTAAYVTIISELTGANADPSASAGEKITLIVLTMVSIALIPAITAALVDSAVKARLRVDRGGVPAGISGHVVVVGLGNVGTRVIRELTDKGIVVVAIERDATAQGVQAARDLGIPVIIGDATRAEVINSAAVATCRALVVVSTDDVNNLEISLLGRAAQPNLRVVLRLFDGDFARRVQRAFGISTSRSVTYLAAPAFAAAMLGRNVVATIPVRRRVLIVAELPVRAGSRLEGHVVSEVTRPHEARLLAIRTGRDDQTLWFPSGGRRLVRTDRLVVIATRAGFGRLLVDTRTQRNLPERRTGELLDPWVTPPMVSAGPAPRHAATDSVDAAPRSSTTVDNPQARPADNDSALPA
jgi:Trk K+ transport system NAD-binding subunit